MRRATLRGGTWENRSERCINVAIKCSVDEMAGENESETGWIMTRQSKFKDSN